MSAARPTWWWPKIPGLKKIEIGWLPVAPASTANRSRTRCNSSASSGVTKAFAGGEATRYATPEIIGTRTSRESTAAYCHVTIRGVVPVTACNPPAHFRYDSLLIWRAIIQVPRHKLDDGAFIQSNGDGKTAVTPRIGD